MKTAETIAESQTNAEGVDTSLKVVQVPELREKDFGSEEGKRFGSRGKEEANLASSAADWVQPESQQLMRIRVERFVDAFFVPTVLEAASSGPDPGSVIIVAHGIILNVLLRTLLTRFGPKEIAKLAKPGDVPWRSEWLASWSNTGYLEADLRVTPQVADAAPITSAAVDETSDGPADSHSPIVHAVGGGTASSEGAVADTSSLSSPPTTAGDIQLTVKTVNCVDHLQGLKKARGGIGNVGHDEKQRTVDSFFTRPAKKLKHDEGAG